MGDTFDTGYEFAKSPFRYERHPEILYSDHTWKNTFLCSYAKLHADDVPYAGYPNGIPEGLPFGTFFGRQAEHFLRDLGFDFIWFSNGLGFTREYWTTVGPVFNGERFIPEAMDFVQKSALEFWDLFTAECSFPIETRGTNMTMGIDMATDAVPLGAIYKKNPTMLPPPNSPWAALNGDYGLEIAGYLSRIAELPAQRYLFRYYLHDPWWANSPWYDRYNGMPHDIYLPLACARIDENGKVQTPTDLSFLTIDNSFGEMPDSCVNEPIPHLLKGRTPPMPLRRLCGCIRLQNTTPPPRCNSSMTCSPRIGTFATRSTTACRCPPLRRPPHFASRICRFIAAVC